MKIIEPKLLEESAIATKAQLIKLIGAGVLIVNTVGFGGILTIIPENMHKHATTVMTVLSMGGIAFGVSGSDRILKERVAKGDLYTNKPNDGHPDRADAKAQVILENKIEEEAFKSAKGLLDRGIQPGNLEAQVSDLQMKLEEQRKLVAQYGDAFKGLAQTKTMMGNSGGSGDAQTALPPVPFVTEGSAVKTVPDRILDVGKFDPEAVI